MKLTELGMIVIGGGLIYSGVTDFRWLAFLKAFAVTQDTGSLLKNIKHYYGSTAFTSGATTASTSGSNAPGTIAGAAGSIPLGTQAA